MHPLMYVKMKSSKIFYFLFQLFLLLIFSPFALSSDPSEKYNYDEVVISNNSRRCVTVNGVPMELDPFSSGDEGTNAAYLEWMKNQIKVMNKYRKWHGVPPVALNFDICKSAHYTTEYLTRHPNHGPHTNSFTEGGQHKLSCNENGFGGLHFLPNGDVPTGVWYDEIRFYDFINPETNDFMKIGHFKNVIDRGTKEACVASVEKNGQHKSYAQYYGESSKEERNLDSTPPLLPKYRRRTITLIEKLPDVPNSSQKIQNIRPAEFGLLTLLGVILKYF